SFPTRRSSDLQRISNGRNPLNSASYRLTDFSTFRDKRRYLGLTALQHVCQAALSHLVDGGIKPENLKRHRITFAELIERLHFAQIEGPVVILAIELKIELNQKVTLVVPLSLWLIVMVVLLIKLTVRLFSCQNAIQLYAVFT